ncbi:hypothetical protein A3A93_06595 [Candidatus Roizmanbacteria bacterium RIFCSPLOWO2_01_FULL_38_12]|uniref:Glutamine amidotransferase type-2 domain-containing protein n=1 Tax=Candidatus Roizmanbacteria bacterium RIFCSPLOWO2_01_FULL_38_12 TaxID=1802061 RepID=A0A1F7IXN8_9BACT|nr:MAG: hypothetical protein A3A93_06595 [Candidatus Roizmanbacteria bacterium RIFCSPLOWO2_01_FULL_38_12]
MCRFLLAESERPFNPENLISKFATMAKSSHAYDGDWQGDGCGVAWLEDGIWRVRTSVLPFWDNLEQFVDLPATNHVVMHARSASFPQDKGIVAYNQPYVNGRYAFVFNGLLKGVNLPFRVEGRIGAQKIWSLLQKFLADNPPRESLEITVDLLNEHSREIQALNIGLCDEENIYYYSQYGEHPDYYNLRIQRSKDVNIVCSEDLECMSFEKVETGKVCVL